MTISNTLRRNQYTANGVLTTFSYDYEIFDEDDLKVYVDQTLQTIATHYTVSGVGENAGGEIEFLSAPSSNAIITIVSSRPIERTTSFTTSGVFRATDINTEFDKVISLVGELDAERQRSVRLDTTDTGGSLEIPLTDDRAGKYLAFDTSGDIIANQNFGEWQGDWVTGTAYDQNDVVKDTANDNIYIVKAAHTSGASVAADVSAGNLELVVDAVAAAASASAASASAAAAAASEGAAATSETNAAASAADSDTARIASEAAQAASEAAQALSEAARDSSEDYRDDAQKLAINAEDSQYTLSDAVTTGYSALHYAAKAAASAASAAASAGTLDGKTIADTDGNTSVETERAGNLEKVYVRVNGIDALEVSNATGTALSQFKGNVQLDAQGDLRFADSDTSNYVAFQSPAVVSSNVVWTLPDADANVSGYALVSDAAGNLSWAAAGATVTQDNTTNTNFNLYFAATTSGALTALKYDGADLLFNPSTSTLTCTYFSGQSTSAQYADLAEIYASDCPLEAGDVVMIGGDKEITLCSVAEDVFGVISTAPGFLLNAGAKGYPVALKGRVPVKLKGPLHKGQLIVLSDEHGVAMGAEGEKANPFSVIGKAIHDKTTDTKELVEIILT